MNNRPRFRLKAIGREWYCLPVNEAAEALKVPAWKLYTKKMI